MHPAVYRLTFLPGIRLPSGKRQQRGASELSCIESEFGTRVANECLERYYLHRRPPAPRPVRLTSNTQRQLGFAGPRPFIVHLAVVNAPVATPSVPRAPPQPCARARGGLPHLLVLLVSIVVKELQTKLPRQVHPVSDSLELFGEPRAEVWWPAVSATAWSLSTSACRTGSSSCH